MAAGVKNVDANVETTQVSRPAKRRLWLQIAAAVLVPVVVLVIVEVSLRIAGVGFSTSLLVPCAVKGTPGVVLQPVLRHSLFSNGDGSDSATLQHPQNEGSGNISHFRARRISGHGRSRQRIRIQPVS